MSSLKALLANKWLAIGVQVALGCVFVAAAWPKLLSPPAFAKNVWAYDLLPDTFVTLMAVFLPALEMVVGLALIVNFRPRAAAWISLGMLLQFTVALSINAFLRERPVNCSCFELEPAPKTCAMLLLEMKWLILRDVLFVLMAAHVIRYRGPRAGPAGPPQADAAA